jgi:type II secretory pathway pseudopilin PulG
MNSSRGRGFTILELTIALTLMVVLMGLVVIRLGFGSSRQQTIDAARKVGNIFSTYREKAMTEECLYAFRLDAATGQYAVFQPAERNPALLDGLTPLKTCLLQVPIKFGKILIQGNELTAPVTVFLDPKGFLPDLSIEIVNESGTAIQIHPDPVVNEVQYDER